jgi:hypothetical protein
MISGKKKVKYFREQAEEADPLEWVYEMSFLAQVVPAIIER